MEEKSVKEISSLVLAYLGDAVFEVIVRDRLVRQSPARPNELNKRASRIVCAASQAKMIDALLPLLTEEEEAVYRRGRNAHSPTTAKNQSVGDYRKATGFEALIGYLHLMERGERITELVEAGLASLG